MLIKCSPNGPG